MIITIMIMIMTMISFLGIPPGDCSQYYIEEKHTFMSVFFLSCAFLSCPGKPVGQSASHTKSFSSLPHPSPPQILFSVSVFA